MPLEDRAHPGRPPGSASPWTAGHQPQLVDIALVAVLLGLGFVQALWFPRQPTGTYPRHEDVWGMLLVGAIVAPLAVRRRAPIAAMAVSVLAFFARLLAGYAPVGITDIAELLAVYSVGVYGRRPEANFARWVGGLAVAAGFSLAYVAGWYPWAVVALMFVTWVGVAVFGETVYMRRRYADSLEERARRLETERDERARLAVQDERARIAREFHDIWAHTLSVVVVQAGAAQEVFDDEPEQARAALAQIQQAGRQALAEVRRLIAREPVQDGAGGLQVTPGLADLESLVSELGRAGLRVDLAVAGQVGDLPEDLSLAAYRVVQQALTNTLSHAGSGARARVDVRRTAEALRVEVLDDGPGEAGHAELGEPGRQGVGLVGMRERVALFGGEVSAAPRPEGGFAVRAVIPLEGAS